jgi:hypothetical protein
MDWEETLPSGDEILECGGLTPLSHPTQQSAAKSAHSKNGVDGGCF